MNQAIISLKPRYASLVLSGAKTVELRNRIVRLKPGTWIWIYATRPMGRIVGVAEIESVVHAGPAEIWRRFGEDLGVDRSGFDSYVGNRERVSALVLGAVEELGGSMTLDRIRRSVRAFQPPQFYAHLPAGNQLRGTLDRIREVEAGSALIGERRERSRREHDGSGNGRGAAG